MKETNRDLIRQGWEIFTRIFMKYDILEKSPVDIGIDDKLNGAQIHMIEAVGKGYGETVTELSKYFMVTKGAVSQIISRLHKMGYIAKTKRTGNDKEIILELTDKGHAAFQIHEKYNESTVAVLMHLMKKYDQNEAETLLSMLTDIDQMLGVFVAEEKRR
jgi:DNA-binding MarR family transcriptional regulator